MSAINLINLQIDEKAHSYAKIYSAMLIDEYQRKRAYASIVALFAFLNVIEKKPLNIQKSMTLFRNPIINEQYEIADLYVNNWHLDVRVVKDADAVLIPKIHYETGIVPDFYVVINVDSDLKTAELVGFIDTKINSNEAFDYHYYKVPFSKLINFDEFLNKIKETKQESFEAQEHELCEKSYLALMDGGLDTQTKNEVLKHLFRCNECRSEFCCLTGFEMVSCNINKYPDILDDKTLQIIGAQNVDDAKYEGKEETIYIGNDEEIKDKVEEELPPADTQEPDVDDILDELFSDEDNLLNAKNKQQEVSQPIHPYETEIADYKAPTENNIPEEQEPSHNKSGFNQIPDIALEEVENENLNSQGVETSNIEPITDEMTLYNDDTPSLQENSGNDFEIIEDDVEDIDINSTENTSQDVEYIEDEGPADNSKNDFIIEDEQENLDTVTDDNLYITEDNTDSELVVINNDEDVAVSIEDENNTPLNSEEDKVQKVIVDYDDTGEPIYSYITSVNQEEADSIVSEAEPVLEEENSLNENEELEPVEPLEEYSDTENLETTEEIYPEETLEKSEEEQVLEDNATENTLETEIINTDEADTEEPSIDKENEEITNDLSTSENITPTLIENTDTQSKELRDILLEDDDTDEAQTNQQDLEEVPSENKEYDIFDSNSNETSNEDEEDDDEEYDEYEKYEELNSKPSNKAIIIFVGLFVTIGLIGGAFFISKGLKNKASVASLPSENITVPDSQTTNDMFEQPITDDGGLAIPVDSGKPIENAQNNTEPQPNDNIIDKNLPMPPKGSLPVPPPIVQQPSSNGDVNKAITNAFIPTGGGVSLRGLNWFCTAELFTDPTFKNYLQNLDNTLKQNIKNNIMGIVQTPPNDQVAAKFAVDNNGNLKKVIISESSGSEQIDNIVLQSINESFQGEKSQILNDSTLKSDMYYLKVVIKL